MFRIGSGSNLLALFVQRDEGVYGATLAGLDQRVSIRGSQILQENDDAVVIEFPHSGYDVHAVPEPDAQVTIDADLESCDHTFLHVIQRHYSLEAEGSGISLPTVRRS
jgi:hypothetical protein